MNILLLKSVVLKKTSQKKFFLILMYKILIFKQNKKIKLQVMI